MGWGTKGGLRGPKRSSGGPRWLLSASYFPLAKIKLFILLKVFKNTSNLLTLHIYYKWGMGIGSAVNHLWSKTVFPTSKQKKLFDNQFLFGAN